MSSVIRAGHNVPGAYYVERQRCFKQNRFTSNIAKKTERGLPDRCYCETVEVKCDKMTYYSVSNVSYPPTVPCSGGEITITFDGRSRTVNTDCTVEIVEYIGETITVTIPPNDEGQAIINHGVVYWNNVPITYKIEQNVCCSCINIVFEQIL